MASTKGSLSGKVVLITGAGGGIGQALCATFAKEGAHVAAVDIHRENVQRAIRDLEGCHHCFYTDVSSRDAVAELMLDIQEKFDGKIPTVAVCAAGNALLADLLEMTEECFDSLISVHLKGTFFVMQAVAKCMIEKGIKDGTIITFSSSTSTGKFKTIGGYAACKAGIISLTKTAATEWSNIPIRCNAVWPGPIDTPLLDPDVGKQAVEASPLGRLGTPQEVADACLFLASDKSSYITGTVVEVAGGL